MVSFSEAPEWKVIKAGLGGLRVQRKRERETEVREEESKVGKEKGEEREKHQM